jgi:hypothetical protein
MNHFFARINFRHLVDNATTRIGQAPKRKLKMKKKKTINENDNNPNITQRKQLRRHICVEGKH